MGLYGMIFGKSANSEDLLKLLGLTEGDFYRFRDCYLTENGEIAVYTRGGGDNRRCATEFWHPEGWEFECKDDVHSKECVVTKVRNILSHPLYLRDEDDRFDRTYATYYFKAPEIPDSITPETNRDEAWQLFISHLSKPD